MRQPYQVLVIPYHRDKSGKHFYAAFFCNGDEYWQPISGGGEDNETILNTAMREAFEEAGIPQNSKKYLRLVSMTMIPAEYIGGFKWGEDVIMEPEYCFGVEVDNPELILSEEHSKYEWLDYDAVYKRYTFESNKLALWELNHRLINNKKDIRKNLEVIHKIID